MTPSEHDRERALEVFKEILPASNQNSSFARERKMEAIFAIEKALAAERSRTLNLPEVVGMMLYVEEQDCKCDQLSNYMCMRCVALRDLSRLHSEATK